MPHPNDPTEHCRPTIRLRSASLALLALLAPATVFAQLPELPGVDFDADEPRAEVLADSGGLALDWISGLGSGYSGLVADEARVYTMFTAGEVDVLGAFDAKSGDEVWRYEVGPKYAGHDGSHDGPSSTPALVDGDRICGLAPRGALFCAQRETGKELWRVDLQEKFGAEKPWYGMSTTPLAVGDRLIVEFTSEGGSVSAFALADGERLWTAGSDTINYQSPTLLEVGGSRQILAVGDEWLYGLDPDTGAVLWEHEYGGDGAAIGSGSLQPISAGGGRVLLMHARGESKLVEILPEAGGGFRVEEQWTSTAIKNSYTPPVYHDGYFYGYSNRFLACVDAETGEAVWRSREPGDGFLTAIEGQLAVLTKKGSVHLVEMTPEEYRETNRYELFEDPAWTTPLYLDDSLYVRSMSRIAKMSFSGAVTKLQTISVPEGMETSFMYMLIGGLLNTADPFPALDSLWRTVDTLPVLEGNTLVHFLYRGEAEDVALVSDITGSRHEEKMTRLPGTDFFWVSKFADAEALFTYHFVVDFEEEIHDPMNPKTVEVGDQTRSWYSMPAFREPAYLQADEDSAEIAEGRVERIEIEYEGYEGKTPVDVYLPAGYDESEDRYPTVYVQDAEDAMGPGEMVASLDRLLASGSVEPLVVVFVHEPKDGPGETPAERWAAFSNAVAGELVPKIDAEFRTLPDRDARGLFGAAWSAPRALYAALEHEDLFGRVAMHSSYYLTTGEKILDGAFERSEGADLVLYVDWGSYDIRTAVEAWDMPATNRLLVERLEAEGYEPMGGEVPHGSGWFHWKRRVGDSLTALFPGPNAPADEAVEADKPGSAAAR